MVQRELFVRIGKSRIRRPMKSIELIGNLSNRHRCEFKNSDVEKMFRAPQGSLRAARRRSKTERAQSDSFTLQ